MKAANKQFQIRKGLAQVRHMQILENNSFLGCSLFIFAYAELWQARATLWLWHMGSRVWLSGCGILALGCGSVVWHMGSMLWLSGCGTWALGCGSVVVAHGV